MQRLKVLIICVAALLTILAATVGKWSSHVALTDNQALGAIFAAEFLLFIGLIYSMRHHAA
ncbi:hypothetical protein [Sphingomonas alpina]|uniref:Uncharacterized protein n=1 Tax=Sphingomonas alpina TaxID=653931 RepID=A0A7H0LGT0_9SPHN|nr:hypothetical protein [Sphingomonas alpina]QNQ08883.1 hypothetical protein H3Z74_19565 [Sphingomonas alpina]